MPNLALKNLLHDKLRSAITIAGVAFAVTLVFVQVGLFMGLLDNASVTIDHIDADLWVTSRNTPNVDFAHGFPQGLVQRVRSVPGVERADNLIVWFLNLSLPNGAEEGMLVYALEDFTRWGIPWNVESGDLARPAPRRLHLPRRLGRAALRHVRGRRLPRGHRPAGEDHRPQPRGALLHDDADRLPHLRPGAGALRRPDGRPHDLRPGEARAGRRRDRGRPPRSAAGCRTTTSTPRRTGRSARAATGSPRPASA